MQEDDILIFAGDTENIADMIDSNLGLRLPSVGMLHKKKQTEIVEIVVLLNGVFFINAF